MTIFTDNFSDNSNGWSVRDDPQIFLQAGNGGYTIEHRQDSGWWAVWRIVPNHTQNDLGIQIKVQKILGAMDSYYGIVWGLVDTNNFCYMLVNLKKQITIGKYSNNEWRNTIPWTVAPIQQEAGSINEIAIFIRKNILELHINGFQVLKNEWSNVISGNNIGILVGHSLKVKILELTISTENSVQIPQAKKFSPSTIKRTHVDSSNLKSVGYDNTSQTLEIEFINGAIYQYYGVSQRIYVELMQAESHGKYFYAFIRDIFQYQQTREKIMEQNDSDDSDYDNHGDYDYSDYDDVDPHDDALGMWIDLGGGERIWHSYLDDD